MKQEQIVEKIVEIATKVSERIVKQRMNSIWLRELMDQKIAAYDSFRKKEVRINIERQIDASKRPFTPEEVKKAALIADDIIKKHLSRKRPNIPEHFMSRESRLNLLSDLSKTIKEMSDKYLMPPQAIKDTILQWGILGKPPYSNFPDKPSIPDNQDWPPGEDTDLFLELRESLIEISRSHERSLKAVKMRAIEKRMIEKI